MAEIGEKSASLHHVRRKGMDVSDATSNGSSLVGLLTIAFVVLKLCHVIDWSWCWVLSPLWIPIVALVIILFVFWIIYLIMRACE